MFYVTLLPQFIPAWAPVLGVSMLLAGIHAGEGIVWLSLLLVVMHRIGAAMRRPAVRRCGVRRSGGGWSGSPEWC